MRKESGKIKVGISCGDLNGIGLEIIIKTFLDNRVLELVTPVLYASSKTCAEYRKALEIKDFSFNEIKKLEDANPKRANVINVWDDEVTLTLGKPTKQSGELALKSLQAATADLKAGKIDALITAPIDKNNIQSEEFKFPGHTEYLASEFETDEYAMLMVSENLKVTFMTGHLPLAEVGKKLSFESIIKKIRFLDRNLPKDFGIRKPKIAVLGLNPHNGDGGILGSEEQEFIAPAIKKAKEDGILVFGPYAADGFFGSGAYRNFDVVLAMYHDQGLIPFKTLNFDQGVNYTAGLPAVRVSPDHGTGYDIAGKGIASEQSFRDALFLAIDLIRERERFEEYTSDVLQPQSEKRSSGRKPQDKRKGQKKAASDEQKESVSEE
ncbi:MAG: 4-hydroxythreonine-4-phosphate dehydrogenase PdxA [Flavobacteriales bacterium]|nr:4-hydroxythreonine-4-phosphate dehydrogenase PdxA [Flavobacteriales bacterium]MCB9192752.1 4-hydroxythreonine-4-phosphate dehydrogenase PdxA [Flavobacteriales bacterium]MCB9204890.1 4-hydroxythreonine-4-phosphate dehydrogenase PdxA [Flavobacteriales bacterium]